MRRMTNPLDRGPSYCHTSAKMSDNKIMVSVRLPKALMQRMEAYRDAQRPYQTRSAFVCRAIESLLKKVKA